MTGVTRPNIAGGHDAAGSLERVAGRLMELTGAPSPSLFEPDAPVLADDALAGGELYLIGLIGGKDVGKSALVNALAGREITERTGHGPGTETVIAYCHAGRRAEVSELLGRIAPGRHRIVTHEVADLSRQVLVDLPDIDSHYLDHVELTRRMLRHLLYPIWIQSIEKYADARPRELLKRVAAGNAPENFLFCLNKVDQLIAHEGAGAVGELRDDYAARMAGALELAAAPKVLMISALAPGEHDLPELRRLLSRQKSTGDIAAARASAGRRRADGIVQWAKEQDFEGRLEQLGRLLTGADELVAERLGRPLLERTLPALADDPALRLSLVDACLGSRMARWPIVGMIHTLLSPVVAVLRRRFSLRQQRGMGGSAALVGNHLEDANVADAVQSTFSRLQRDHPRMSLLYRSGKLWERPEAEGAEAELRRRLGGAIERRRGLLVEALGRHDNVLLRLWRALLTVGALLWFPLMQPMTEALLGDGSRRGLTELALVVVRIFSVQFLLTNAVFLLIWFGILWAIVRWNTQRQVDRHLSRWKSATRIDPAADPTATTVGWLATLTAPIAAARGELAELLKELDAMARG